MGEAFKEQMEPYHVELIETETNELSEVCVHGFASLLTSFLHYCKQVIPRCFCFCYLL